MEERNIQISLEKAREWYNKGGDLRTVALQAFKEEELKYKLPKTWEECYRLYSNRNSKEYIDNNSNIISMDINCKIGATERNRNIVPLGMGSPMLALMQLLICRDIYRNGWKPNWRDDSFKYVIEYCCGDLDTDYYIKKSHILSFQSEKVRNEFLENFKDLIEEAKELI